MNKRLLVYRYILSDALAAVIVWILFMAFRKTVNDGQVFSNLMISVPNYDFFTTLFLFPVSCLLVHYLSGYYVNPIKESKFTEFFTTFFASLIISFSVFFVLIIDDVVVSYVYYYYSLLVLFGLTFVITLLFRGAVGTRIRQNFRDKKMTIHTLLVGAGQNAKKISEDITRNSIYNTVIGFVKTDKSISQLSEEKIVGDVKNIHEIIIKHSAKQVIIALDDADENKLFGIINELFSYDVEILFTPRLYEILTGSRVHIHKYGINPLVSVSQPSMTDWEQSVKRFADIVLSTLSLIILSPLLLYFAIAIKIDSKGAVFYAQERIGYHGKRFKIYKLRSMRADSENGSPQLSSANDDRITRVGRILRKYRLDEIPQFWNIIKGDMSIVGPRPERQFFIDKIIQKAPYYCLLYKIRPGLTSWGPIKIGYSDSLEKMIERLNYDIVYMENMSLINDIKIVLFTFKIVFTGKGI